MNLKYFTVIALALAPAISFAGNPDGYGRVPHENERANPQTGYRRYMPLHTPLEIVNEGSGTPNPALSAMVTDSSLQQKIQSHGFTSLQVHDLDIFPNNVQLEDGVLKIPYAVSVKHTQTSHACDQGTIEVTGTLVIRSQNNQLSVEVVSFDDSNDGERLGRGWPLHCNGDIDLNFARQIAKPVLEGYFNAEPSRVNGLIELRPAMLIPRGAL